MGLIIVSIPECIVIDANGDINCVVHGVLRAKW